ncbi:hypothetical protein J5J83_07730 [Azoarcus sp. L1K30]|uniref:hypothetical protein n=1 Tax=Azoarcus sp. L1K30 TaxID=2820277 RepID=UPI001B83473C|nr:hypothetical protein [Azoarcus sp. L1K30]MBR0566001.1 hypothetical protein [Azoarcus sp. L1K30]
MSSAFSGAPDAVLPADPLSALAVPDVQRQAARMAQDAFGRVFRLSLEATDQARAEGVNALCEAMRNWAQAGEGDDASALRLAMLIAGADQWGLAWSQAFELAAIPGLTELLGALRTGLDPQAESRFLQQFEAVNAAEANAIDFKVELRRGIHLALWHAAIASEERDEAMRIVAKLGGLLMALVRDMPIAGWRLVADALAHVQLRCLAEGLATEGIAQEATQSLFAALSRELPKAERDVIMAHAAQAVMAWQRASRPSDTVH